MVEISLFTRLPYILDFRKTIKHSVTRLISYSQLLCYFFFPLVFLGCSNSLVMNLLLPPAGCRLHCNCFQGCPMIVIFQESWEFRTKISVSNQFLLQDFRCYCFFIPFSNGSQLTIFACIKDGESSVCPSKSYKENDIIWWLSCYFLLHSCLESKKIQNNKMTILS